MSPLFVTFWGALFAIGGIVELVALARPTRGDTLSEQVWFIRSRIWGRPLFYGAWAWLSWHFAVEEAFDPHRHHWWDDYSVLAGGFALGLWLALRLRHRTTKVAA